MTKYLPLSLAILLTVTAFLALILLVQSTDESTKAQMNHYEVQNVR